MTLTDGIRVFFGGLVTAFLSLTSTDTIFSVMLGALTCLYMTGAIYSKHLEIVKRRRELKDDDD